MTSNLNYDPIRSFWRLCKSCGYMQELIGYLKEKTFERYEVIFWTNASDDEVYCVFDNVTTEYMQEIIIPWMWGWSTRNRNLAGCGLPYADYIHNNKIKLIVPLTREEQMIVWHNGRQV